MYKINLNKSSNRLDQFEVQQHKRRVFALSFFFVSLVIITGLAVFFSMKTQNKINTYETELARIDGEIAKLQASAQFISPDDIFALAEVANNRITWTEKLSVLGQIFPEDAVITELYYDYQLKVLRINGVSKVKAQMRDLDLVVAIVDLMKNNEDFAKDFSNIRFSSSTRIKNKGQDMVKFQIECLVR